MRKKKESDHFHYKRGTGPELLKDVGGEVLILAGDGRYCRIEKAFPQSALKYYCLKRNENQLTLPLGRQGQR